MTSPPASQDRPGELVWLHGDRWVPLLVWLSLDAIRPYWDTLGVPRAGRLHAQWIGLFRRAILRATALRWEQPQTPSPLVAEVLAQVDAEMGQAAGRALIRFGRFTFATGFEDHPELFAWQNVLDHCATDAASMQALLPWADRRATLAEALRHTRDSEVRAELRLPLSTWDVVMLALRGIDDAAPQMPEHPMRLLAWTMRAARVRALWRAVLPVLDADQREALAWNASRIGWAAGILPDDITLPDPANLVEPEAEDEHG